MWVAVEYQEVFCTSVADHIPVEAVTKALKFIQEEIKQICVEVVFSTATLLAKYIPCLVEVMEYCVTFIFHAITCYKH